MVLENRNTFETSRANAIRSYRVYGKTVTAKLYEDDTKDRYFHIYYDPVKTASEREQLEQQIEKFRIFAEKHIGTDQKFSKMYHYYFDLKYNKKGILTSVKEKHAVVEQELQLCGYFCIITSEEMTAAEALIQYKGRDVSEKLFQADKTFIGSNSMRTHTARALSAKIFVEFIALIVRNRIYNLLKETMLRLEARQNYLTVPKAIRELEKIEMVRRNSGVYRLDHAVTATQKTILDAFGMTADNIHRQARGISTDLARIEAEAFEKQADERKEGSV